MTVVGIVSPGAMGSAVAEALSRGGARVVATLSGRSERTRLLASGATLELLPDLGAVVDAADVVLSIVPPEAAPRVASDVVRAAVERTTSLLYADLNATAPETAARIAAAATEHGIDVVDGSISGELAALPFEDADRIVVGADPGAASAVKMSTASVYKGSSALLVHALLAAQANGVLEHVLDDLRAGSPDLVANLERRLAHAAAKSARYVGEMREISTTQAGAGLTPALFDAMPEIYETLPETPATEQNPVDVGREIELADLLGRLR